MNNLAIFFLVLSIPLLSLERFEIERGDGSLLTGYFDIPKNESFSLAIVVPGSQKESVCRLHNALQKDLNRLGLCILTLERRGIDGPDKIDAKEFNDSLSLEQHLEDHLLLLAKLDKQFIPGWNGKVAIIGQGDGGRVAASLAGRVKKTIALIIVAAGGAWSPQTETLHSFRTTMAKAGFGPQYIHSFLVQAKNEFQQAISNPKASLQAFGFSYKYWASLLNTNLAKDMSQLKCPIYIVHGELDDRIPIESVDVLAKELKQITFERKEKAGRELMQDMATYKDAFSWLSSHL